MWPRLLLGAWIVLGAACAAAPVAPQAPLPVEVPAGSLAVALGWRGHVDTDVAFEEFFGADHTVAVAFMPQFPHAFAGPILAENGAGTFVVGQADYRWGKGGFRKDGPPALYLQVGDARVVFSPEPPLEPGTWHHLAVVRRGGAFSVYLDGARLAPDLRPGGGELPSGTLRIGRRTDRRKAAPARYEGQFFGLVDDVAVWRRALTDAELAALAAPGARPDGEGLLAALGFELAAPDGDRARSRFSRLSERGVALVPATPGRRSEVDALRLPQPEAALRLPFPPGEAWRVGQAFDARGGTHNGFAAFCWDFELAGAPTAATRGKPVHAAEDGEIVMLVDHHGSGGPDANVVVLQHAPERATTYMHLERGSIAQALGPMARLRAWVPAGQAVGTAGDSGAGRGNYHLHFAVSIEPDDPAFVTVPAVFVDYEVSIDEGRSWTRVERGMPLAGQWVRRTR